MPILPSSTALGARQAPRNRQGIATQDTTAEGRGIAQFGQVIGQIGEEIEKKNDEQAVFEARRKLDQWARTNLYDPENGVVAKRGVDALDLPKKIPIEYDKFVGEVSSTLSSNRQRQVFQEMAQSRRNQVADFTIRHAVTQKEVYEKGQVNADMLASSDRAVLLASNGDPGGAKAEIDISLDRLTSFMKARGASGEEIAGAVKAQSSTTHASAIQAMVTKGDPSGAKAYLDANAGGMLQQDTTRVSGLLKEGLLREKSQAFGDEVIGAGMDMKSALDEAHKRFKGDEEVAASHEVKTRFAEQEAAKSQAIKQVSTEAWSVLMDKGSMSAIPPQMMTTLRAVAPEEERQMRDWLEAKYRRNKADAEGKDVDPQIYYGLRMLAAEHPEEFAKLDLMKSAPMLSKQHEGHLIELQASISKGDLKAMDSQKTVKRTVDIVKQEILSAGIDLTPKEGTQQAKETEAFFGTLRQSLDAATASKGKPLTDDEARTIGLGMLRQGFVQGSGMFFDDKKRAYQLTPEEKTKFVTTPYDKIPPNIRDEINAELRKRNGPPGIYGNAAKNEAEIERIYQRAQNAGALK